MWRAIASNAVTLFAVILFLVGGIIVWGRGEFQEPGPLAQAICLKVDSGSNFARVSNELEEEGAITSGAIFRMGADYSEKSQLLKAGSFLITPKSSMSEIVDAVTKGGASTCGTEVVYRVGIARVQAQVRELDPQTNDFVEKAEFVIGDEAVPEVYTEVKESADTRYRVTFAEGVTSWQIVSALNALDVLSEDITDIPPEGALAPDSYEVRKGQSRADILVQMQEAQEELVAAAWAARDPSVPLNSPEELITLASIIEKETGVASERPTVSSVFINRLNQGMRLQTDPTVIYGITRGRGVLGRGLRSSELRAETPWNTYVIEGLPPTPIANPGRESLMAAGQPDGSEFIFFVADGTGGHAFATTLDEHNTNVARWREIEAERANSNN
ncbi:MAG: endolytic transglycosylase MltG [Paracoccaceae bacterium]